MATSYALMGALTCGKTAELALSTENGVMGHLLYMTCHSSVLHYVLNGVMWCVMWQSVTSVRTVAAWVCAVGVGYVLPVTLAVCGWSVVLYYYLGMMMRQMATDVRIRLLGVTLMGLLIPGIAVWHHLLMLLLGYMSEWVRRRWALS